MPEVLSRLRQQFSDLWGNLDKSQKNRIYITSTILLVVMIVSIVLLTRPNYTTLIRDADPKEVGEMTKILDDKKIWNKVENGGGNIVIEGKDNSKAQAALVQNGYPKTTGMTFEDAFKMIKLNTTESDKKKLWDEYKSKSLSSKLKSLDNVEYADVTLALPEPSPFVGDNDTQKTTANVMVKPKGELTPKQVQGIIAMVASSVENLNPKDITVVDNNLNPLNPDSEDMSAPGSQYDMKLKVKKELEKAVRDLFVGQFDSFDTIRVSANPILDFNSEKVNKKEIANPTGMEGGAVISSDDSKEKLTNAGVNGVPGVQTNPGTTAPSYQIGSGDNSQYDKTQSKKNYDYDETTRTQEKALGAMDMEKSSMSVTLLFGKRVKDDAKLTPEFIDQLKKDVSAATGISVSKVSISKYKIVPDEVEKKQLSDTLKDLFNTYGLFALMLLLVIGLIIVALPRKKKEASKESADLNPALASTGQYHAYNNDEENVPEIDVGEKSEVKKQIDKFVRQKPDAVAQLLRNWLSDEWED